MRSKISIQNGTCSVPTLLRIYQGVIYVSCDTNAISEILESYSIPTLTGNSLVLSSRSYIDDIFFDYNTTLVTLRSFGVVQRRQIDGVFISNFTYLNQPVSLAKTPGLLL
jgi:hypothetical protein